MALSKNSLKKQLALQATASIISILVLAFLSISLAIENLHLKNFYKQAETCKWDVSYNELCGVEYPEDVSVYLFDGVENLSTLAGKKADVQGMYLGSSKDILLMVHGNTIEEIKSTFRHELAHYYYWNNMTAMEHSLLTEGYKVYCQSENEFYAYETERYGYYKYFS